MMAHLLELRKKKEELEKQEKELDERYQRMQQCFRNISEDTTNDQYPLQHCFLYLCVRYYKSTRMGRGAVIGVYNDREYVRKFFVHL